jgi:hypothetical protein
VASRCRRSVIAQGLKEAALRAETRRVLLQIFFASFLFGVSAVIHAFGTVGILRLVGRHHREPDLNALHRPVAALVVGLLLVFMLHMVEVTLWALAYFLLLDAFPTFETALYYSLSTFSTVGYGDVILPEGWRILGAAEGVAGIVLLGWSGGLVLVVLERTNRLLLGIE